MIFVGPANSLELMRSSGADGTWTDDPRSLKSMVKQEAPDMFDLVINTTGEITKVWNS